jgi:ribonuclease HI
VFCDGSCLGNPGPGGWAVLLFDESGKEISSKTGGDIFTTNNRMELTAAYEALLLADGPCALYTDSKYLVGGITMWMKKWLTNGWKSAVGPVKNQDLWLGIHTLSEKHQIEWNWLKGHNNHHIHDQVDVMARETALNIQGQLLKDGR